MIPYFNHFYLIDGFEPHGINSSRYNFSAGIDSKWARIAFEHEIS